jgi:hypothetical protein
LNWPQSPNAVQPDEEWVVYDAKAAFAAAFPQPTPAQLSALQAALDKENDADVAYIATVNASLSAGKSDFTAAIADIDSAVAALTAFLSSSNVATANDAAAKAVTDANDKRADIAKHH